MKKTTAFLILSLTAGYIHAQVAGTERNTNGTTCVSLDRGDQCAAIFPVFLPAFMKHSDAGSGPELPGRLTGEPFDLNKIPAVPGLVGPYRSESSIFDWKLKFTVSGKVFKDVSFADDHTGYIVTELGSVYKTVNGGDSWTSVMNLGFPYYWYGVYALTPDTVVIAGFNDQAATGQGVIRWSYNGGSTWQPNLVLTIPVSGVGWLDRVHFFGADTGVVFNSLSGGCWITTSGGKDNTGWDYININTDLGWFAGNIDFDRPGKVSATGIHLAESQDYGQLWNSGPCADQTFDGGVDFLDSDRQLGWTGGGQISAPISGWIHRTTDGGLSWSGRLQTFPYPIRALTFFNASTGLALGGNVYSEAGGIYSTSDSGMTWNLEMNTAAEMFSMDYKIISADSMDVWCVGSTGSSTGYQGKLYKARTVNLITGARENRTAVINGLLLDQNSPNPFPLSTMIRFYIPSSCRTTLKVFDLTGREIRTLCDGVWPAGFSALRFDTEGLRDGIYYYRLFAGDRSETRKLVIRKQ